MLEAQSDVEGLRGLVLQREAQIAQSHQALEDMRACCFNSVALAIKVQLAQGGEEALRDVSIADMYERATAEDVPQHRWGTFVLDCLGAG